MKFTNPSKYDQLIFTLEEGSSFNIFGAFVHKDIFAKLRLLAFSRSIAFSFLRSRITLEQLYVLTELDVRKSYQNGAEIKSGQERKK